MGIDIAVVYAIHSSLKYTSNYNNVLTLGRQEIHTTRENIKNILNTDYKSYNMLRSDTINSIIDKYGLVDPYYLEIGVWTGTTFKEIKTKNKDGVDPEQYCKCEYVNYKMTSDNFFKNHINKKYDIIFIDGLHTAHKVTADIYNSIKSLNNGGFLVLDDVYPHKEREQEALDLRRLGEHLTGDVWKGVYNILDELESISSDIYFIRDVERGHLIFKIEDTSKNITVDNTMPNTNIDGFNPCEWNKYTYSRDFPEYLKRLEKFKPDIFCDNFFKSLGFKQVDSTDFSNEQNPTFTHNMNTKIEIQNKYDYIFDGGTIEHIFNIPQLFDNIVSLLNIDGVFCSITANNNFSGHGFYQFSPNLFKQCFTSRYGMELKEMYLCFADNYKINIQSVMDFNTYNKRQEFRFDTNSPVYIITVAKKISHTGISFIKNPPTQYSYEKNKTLFVTSFKDIGRSKWNSYFRRDTEDYISYFGNLVKTLQYNNSDIICFCDDDIKSQLLDRFNFKNSYPYDKDNTFYKFLSIEQAIINKPKFKRLISHRIHHPECFSAEYNIINHNKVIFIDRAKYMFPNYNNYCWIDFGYKKYPDIVNINIGNIDKIIYSKCSQYNYDVAEEIDPIQMCSQAPDIIQGSMFIIPSNLVQWYVQEYKKMLLHYHQLDIVDDDQAIAFQIYKNNKQLFDLKILDWHTLLFTNIYTQ